MGRKFWQVFFLGRWFDLSRDFLDIQNNRKIHGGACASRLHSSANKLQPNLFLPRCSCLEFSFIMLLLKQKMFLGVPSVVRMTTRRGKDKISWYDEHKQTQTFNFQCFFFFGVLYHSILSGNF